MKSHFFLPSMVFNTQNEQQRDSGSFHWFPEVATNFTLRQSKINDIGR